VAGRHRLGRSLRRITLRLVERHQSGASVSLTMWDLLEAGWPGERPAIGAGANRVYVAIARLRGMGLRDSIERFEDGYRIAPAATIRIAN